MKTAQKALVLGGATGLLGQALAEVLLQAGWNVIVTSRKDIDYCAANGAKKLEALVDRVQPACIFNTVAYTQVDKAEDDEEAATLLNRSVPAMLGRIIKPRPVRLVHYSTDFVFNGRKATPYLPEDPTNPTSAYGRTKLAGEEALLQLDLPRCVIVRTAWLFGPGKGNFIRTILSRCAAHQPLSVVHDQVGSPTYTLDLAKYSLKLVEAEGRGIFHIVNSGQASWCELASEAVRLAQAECTVLPVPSSAYPQKALRPAWSVLGTSAFTRVTGITPRPWPQALRDYIYRDFTPPNNNS